VNEDKEFISATELLNRAPEKEYISEWTHLLQRERFQDEAALVENSVVIFRLGGEWLAINTKIFAEIAENKSIHKIPHRSNTVLLGVVNLRGQLRLCIALHTFMDIELVEETQKIRNPRMVAIQSGMDKWIFPVDDVFGIYRCDLEHLKNVPVTVAKSTASYLKGMIEWEGKNVGYVDEELLLYSLRRKLL
jgi:chemotaxis-related protein WspD